MTGTWTPSADIDNLPPYNVYVLVTNRDGLVSMMYRGRHGHGHGRGWCWYAHSRPYKQEFIVGWMYAPKGMEVPK